MNINSCPPKYHPWRHFFKIKMVFCFLICLTNPGLHINTFCIFEIVKHTLQSVSTHKMAIEIFSALIFIFFAILILNEFIVCELLDKPVR